MGLHCSWRDWGCLKSGEVSPLHGYCESAYHQVQRAAACSSLLRFSPLVNSCRLNRNGIISVQGYQYQKSGSIRFRPKVSSSCQCQREGERARQKWCAFLKKNSTLIFFLFKLKAQYSQINNPFLDPKPEGKIHFWYSE